MWGVRSIPEKGCKLIVNVFVLIVIIAIKHQMDTINSVLVRIAFKAKCYYSLSLLLLASKNN